MKKFEKISQPSFSVTREVLFSETSNFYEFFNILILIYSKILVWILLCTVLLKLSSPLVGSLWYLYKIIIISIWFIKKKIKKEKLEAELSLIKSFHLLIKILESMDVESRELKLYIKFKMMLWKEGRLIKLDKECEPKRAKSECQIPKSEDANQNTRLMMLMRPRCMEIHGPSPFSLLPFWFQLSFLWFCVSPTFY